LKIHFIGIGGMGLSALALWSQSMGYEVTGSDLSDGPMIKVLKDEGIKIKIGKNEILDHPDLVVVSSAIPKDEMIAFSKNGIKIVERMDFIISNIHPLIGVSGTDGKSSTTLMSEWIALKNGLDASMICGAIPLGFSNGTFRAGQGGIVLEVDESDPKIENISSQVAILTNLRYDHLDRYKDDPDEQLRIIKRFLNNAKYTVTPADFDFNSSMKFGKGGDIEYEKIDSNFKLQRFLVKYNGKRSTVSLPIAGIHQICNATAAIAGGLILGFSLEDCSNALSDYPGLRRRLEILYGGKSSVVDDYAHTPDEVRGALESVRPYFKNIVAIFEPHRYTRYARYEKEFSNVLSIADQVYVTDIFGAFEDERNVGPKDLVSDINLKGKVAHSVRIENVVDELSKAPQADLYLFMGAGNITYKAHEFAEVVRNW
jgi:UDP-N-acetylmuramate--alanine ligase